MAFTGKWKRSGTENATQIMLHLGMSKEVLESLKDAEAVMEIKQDGDTFDEVYTVGPKVSKTVLKLGEECEITAWNGDKLKVKPVSAGTNKFKVEYEHNGVHHSGVRELTSPTEFVDHVDLDHGKVVGKFIYTKCD